MLGALLDRCRQPDDLRRDKVCNGHDIGDGGLAFGQRPGLVEHQRSQFTRLFERGGVLDQDARLCAATDADHDRRGRCQAQRTRARDHQHRHRIDDRGLDAGADEQPAKQCDERDRQHRRHEHRRHAIGEPLHGRFRSLCGFDQPDDPRQCGISTHARGTTAQRAFLVERGRVDPRARALAHRNALAGEHRLDHVRLPVDHLGIDRNRLAGTHQQHVAPTHLFDVDVDPRVVAFDVRLLGLQIDQRVDRRGGACLRARFEDLAQQHQGHDDRRRLEVDVPARSAEHRRVDAQGVRGGGAQGDEHVHVGRAAAQAVPGTDVEALADPELHRRGEQPLQPARQQVVVHAESHRHHLREQRQCEERSDPERAQVGVVVRLLACPLARKPFARGHASAVARLFDRANELLDAHQMLRIAYVRPLRGEIDRGIHPIDPLERLLDARGAGGTGHALDGQIDRFQLWGSVQGLAAKRRLRV